MDKDETITITVQRETLRTAMAALTMLARQLEKPENIASTMEAYADLHAALRVARLGR